MTNEYVRRLEDGRTIAIIPMAVTVGIVCVGDDGIYKYRYCYHRFTEAAAAFLKWNGIGDPPGPWLKLKGHTVQERLGPGLLNDGHVHIGWCGKCGVQEHHPHMEFCPERQSCQSAS